MNQTMAQMAKDLYISQSFAEFQTFLSLNCRFYIYTSEELRSRSNFGMKHAESCDPNRAISCNTTSYQIMGGSSEDFNYNEHYCHLYESTVMATTEQGVEVIYKNSHCAACSGHYNVSCTRKFRPPTYGGLPGGSPGGLPSFSLLMDFDGSKEEHMIFGENRYCRATEYLDMVQDKCVPNTCPRGEIILDGTCTALNMTHFTPNLNISHLTETVILLKVQTVSGLSVNESIAALWSYAAAIFKTFYWRRPKTTLDLDCKYDIENNIRMMSGTNTTTNHSCLLAYISTYNQLLPLNDVFVYSWGKKVRQEFEKLDQMIQHASLKYLLFDPESQGQDICSSGQPQVSRNLVFSRVVALDEHESDYVMNNDTGLWYKYDNAHLAFEINVNSLLEEEIIYFGVFCYPPILSCDRTLVESDSLTVDVIRNGSSLYIGTVEVTDGSYVQLSTERYLVCREYMERGKTQLPQEHESLDSLVQGILTLVGNVLSIAFLVFTLITYTLFPSMRTVPGICIMNLCVSLSLAQLLFQLSPLFTKHSVVCSVMAAIQHYMWLVSFLWMNVLAYITFKTFSTAGMGQRGGIGSLKRYALYAWGFPAAFVIICGIVDYFTVFDVSYGSSSQCWLAGKYGLIYLFAVPLAVIISTNLFMFARTLVSIKRTMDQTKVAKENADNQKQFGIYVKLSSVMGFTWLFGFLANLTVFSAFWYVFIILNTFQGVFIGISFVCNARVMKRFKALFTGETYASSTGARYTKRTDISSTTGSTGSKRTA